MLETKTLQKYFFRDFDFVQSTDRPLMITVIPKSVDCINKLSIKKTDFDFQP